MELSVLLIIVLFVLVSVLSYFVYRMYFLVNKLTSGNKAEDIKKILLKILDQQDISTKQAKVIEGRVKELEEDSKYHSQKVGLIRFNPFNELGGEYSFSLAVLNAKESGIILTSLHARDRTRVYIKEIVNGKSKFDLSAEEKKAIKIAVKK